MGVAKRLLDVAALILALDQIIVGAGVVHARRVVALAAPRVGHRRQRLIIDLDQLGGVLGGGAVLGHHGADRLAENRTLSTASQCCTNSPPEKRFGMLRNGSTLPSSSWPVSTLMTPGKAPRLGGVDRFQPRVRMLAAQKRHVIHAGQLDVVEETAVALDQRHRLVGITDEPTIRWLTNRTSDIMRSPCAPPPARRRQWPDSRCNGRDCRTSPRAPHARWDQGCRATARSP